MELTTTNIEIIHRIMSDAETKIAEATGYEVKLRMVESFKPYRNNNQLLIGSLLNLAADHYNVPIGLIKGTSRERNCVTARHAFFMCAVTCFGFKKVVAGAIVNRHYSTVIHALQQYDNMLKTESHTAEAYNAYVVEAHKISIQ